MDTDVLIVGGGIGGAVLALALGQAGWRVEVLEREAKPIDVVRPEILQESTIRAVEGLGVGPELRERAMVAIHELALRHGREVLFRIDEADLAAAPAAPHSTDPRLTRAIVLEAALRTGKVELIRGAQVTDVARERGRVVGVRAKREGVTFERKARLVVGDDGVRSVVRGGLGIRVKLRLFPLEFVVLDLPRPPVLEPGTVNAWIDPSAMHRGITGALFVPFPGDLTAGVLLMPITVWEREFRTDPELFWRNLGRLVPFAGALREHVDFPNDFTRLSRPYGHASTYVADGAALIGDAAHSMSPAGGQGANAAIWDAIALAEVADSALRAGDLSRERLLAYELRRRPANRRSLWYTRRAVTLLRLGRWLPGSDRFFIRMLRHLGRDEGARRLLARKVATAFLDPGEA